MWCVGVCLVGLSVCLSVGHIREPCITAEPIEMPFGVLTRAGPRNHVLVGGGRDLPQEGAILGLSYPLKSIGGSAMS